MNAVYPEAVKQGIADTGNHNWFWSNPGGAGQVPKHTGTFSSVGGLEGMAAYDNFAEAVKSMKNEEDLEILGKRLKLPLPPFLFISWELTFLVSLSIQNAHV